MKKALAVLVFLSGSMPILLGVTCTFASPKAIEILKLSYSPDVFQAVTLFGVCLIALGVLQFLAGYWVWTGQWAGIVLSRYCGVLILLDGILIYMQLHRPDLGIPDMVKGAIITAVAFFCRKDR